VNADLEVRAEATPNPNSLKFSTNRTLWEGRAQTFSDPVQAFASPLARDLLGIAGVKSIFLLRDFVTVSREPGADWAPIAARVEEALRVHLGKQD
jgi:hypothetical protein